MFLFQQIKIGTYSISLNEIIKPLSQNTLRVLSGIVLKKEKQNIITFNKIQLDKRQQIKHVLY